MMGFLSLSTGVILFNTSSTVLATVLRREKKKLSGE